ncbi:MAG: Fic family protein [Acidobacteriota bacterium]|jgi:cell filamentation protein
MTRIRWRWEEKDFGFRFKNGKGKNSAEYYQAAKPGEFYVVPPAQRKIEKPQMEVLAEGAHVPTAPQVIANPWSNYSLDWDWIESAEGICLNYAGCLHTEEIARREDEGVARAREFVLSLLDRPEPAPITTTLIQQLHKELMGDIYPFAGKWRTVALHKGDGPTRWPLPPFGIQPLMDAFESEILSRTPFIANDNESVYSFLSEVMNEFIAIHPFREGNGRTAFILGDLILMQNSLLPLSEYDQHRHEAAYYAACEAGRLKKNYVPLAELIAEWEEEALARWEDATNEH